jgi:hypothetical protein
MASPHPRLARLNITLWALQAGAARPPHPSRWPPPLLSSPHSEVRLAAKALVKVAPAGRDDQGHEAQRERKAAKRHASTPAEGRHAAKQQEDATDCARQFAELSEPDSRVRLDDERQDCPGSMFAAAADGGTRRGRG